MEKIVLCLVLMVGLMGCDPEFAPAPEFQEGQKVRSVVSGSEGQVIRVKCWEREPTCYYNVRFSGLQATTNTHVLDSDDAIEIAPLSIVENMKAFELEVVK